MLTAAIRPKKTMLLVLNFFINKKTHLSSYFATYNKIARKASIDAYVHIAAAGCKICTANLFWFFVCQQLPVRTTLNAQTFTLHGNMIKHCAPFVNMQIS